jgi:ATP/ADP translocase
MAVRSASPEEREEAARILKLVGGDALRAYEMVERQLATLALRAQVMLSLSGIVITVTGFSGRAVAETNNFARLSISAGIIVVLFSAAVAIAGALRLRWLSQLIADDPLETLTRALSLRNRKSRYIGVAAGLFVTGFAMYVLAIAQLLLAAR